MHPDDLDELPDDICVRCVIQEERVIHHRKQAEYHQAILEEHLQLMRGLLVAMELHDASGHNDGPTVKGASEDPEEGTT